MAKYSVYILAAQTAFTTAQNHLELHILCYVNRILKRCILKHYGYIMAQKSVTLVLGLDFGP